MFPLLSRQASGLGRWSKNAWYQGEMNLPALSEISSENLVFSIAALRRQQRSDEVQFLWLLAELDARKSFAELGYGSLWDYCQTELHLSNGAAGRRITAARILREFPAAAPYLADGRLGLTTLGILKPVLSSENHLQLFDAASFKNERQVDELVRTIQPLSFARDTVVRTLRREPVSTPASVALDEVTPTAVAPPAPTATAPAVMASAPVEVRAVDAELVSLTMRVPKAFMHELAQVTAALSHVVPSRKPQDVFHELMRRTLAEFAKKKGALPAAASTTVSSSASSPVPGRESGTPAPVVTRATASARCSIDATDSSAPESSVADPRKIPVAVVREVWARDGGSCTFVGSSGRRCGSTHQLEVHHLQAAALGGPPTPSNLTLRYRCHNLLAAQQDFGRDFMSRFARKH